MDSSNSGSIQSSSSADNDDFTASSNSIPFLNFPPPPQPPPPLTPHYSSSSFDLLSPFFTAFNSLPPDAATPLHLDPTWPKSFAAASSSHVPAVDLSSNPSTVQAPPQSDLPPAAPTRSSKKRSRASRRAPTTVLTTDTSNFRSMVQQFTGFPTPPFAPPSSSSVAGIFSRPRFDFFHMGGGGADATAPPPYLLRPFAQKVPSSSSSSLVEAIAYMSRATSAAITSPPPAIANTSSPFRDRQLPSVDFQSSNLAFQSVLQSQTPYDLLSSPSPFNLDYVAGDQDRSLQRNLIAADVAGGSGAARSDAIGEESQQKTAADSGKGPGSGSNSRVSSWNFPPD